MKTMMICLLLAIVTFSLADTHIPAGNISGSWTLVNSPYIIDGEIAIQQSDQLTIEPGVQVLFSDHYKFNVYGRIVAEGTLTDSISFTAQDTELGWHSLRFWNTSSNGQDSSRVVYCKLSLGKASGEGNEKYGGAIYCDNSSNILIKDCLITNNLAESHGGGIHCSNSSPNLINVTITENYVMGEWVTYGGGLSCTSNSNPSLENATITGNIAHYGSQAYGGGIYCSNSNPNLANVSISGNNVEGYDTYGSGIYCTESNPTLSNITLSENYNDSSNGMGGGIFCNNNSSPSLEDVVINGNYAHYGGGICCSSNSNPTLENITITENNGIDCGGGLYCVGSSPSLENVAITGNYSMQQGGGIYLIINSNPILTNVIIIDNSAVGSLWSNGGGGIYCSNSNPSLVNIIISGNNVSDVNSDGGGIFLTDCNNMQLENIDMHDNTSSGQGAGLALNNCDSITVINSSFIDNESGYNGGNISISESELTLINSEIIHGHAFSYGGGILAEDSNLTLENTEISLSVASFHGGIYANNSQLILSNCTFKSNSGEYGGAFGAFNSSLLINNTLFYQNSGYSGGNLYFSDSDAIIMNSTICYNSVASGGGGLAGSGDVKLINSIVYGNSEPQFSSNQVGYYSLMQGGSGGIGNIDEDPMFVDIETNDFQLQDRSPCIGMGIDEIEIDGLIYIAPEFDFLGNIRPNPAGSMPDMGAFENILSEPHVGFNDDYIEPVKFHLSNHPNPFNPSTTISFQLSDFRNQESVEIEIFNLKGQTIKSFIVTLSPESSFGKRSGTQYSIIWNGTDQNNNPVASGVYLYKLKVDGKTEAVKKCLLLK